MVRINMGQLVMAIAFAAALLHGTNADDFTVGGTTGWTQPSDPNFYSTWASNLTFEVGDDLVFNFGNSHNVAIVDKAGYDSCSASNAQVITTGPATIPLNTTGAHYFICGVPGHCSSGQKLSIDVVADRDTPPSPSGTTSPPGTTSSPPPPGTTTSPPSAASPRGVAFTVVLMSIAVALFC